MAIDLRTIVAVAIACAISPATALDLPRAKSHLADEYADCASYFAIAKEGFGRGGINTDADRALVASLNSSIQFAITASTRLTSDQLATARIKVTLEQMQQEMKGTFANFSIIAAKYEDACKELMIDPQARMQYWLDKRD